ncbi:helix-turn-helix domain-containing protein [Leucobacter sp. W1153]|uniref:helix-turn-helix domain-containing protein n=1 Tax=Leucobacter sp. W1153 TaxID=3439064 RepID=UPI003F2B9263
MSAQLMARTDDEQLILDEQIREQAQETVTRAHDRKFVGFKAVLDDGSELKMPEHVVRALRFTLHGLTQGNLTVTSIPDVLTTTTAAKLLGVSRPTLRKLIDSGELPASKTGSHHKLRLEDVLALKVKRHEARRVALDALRQVDDELGIDN